MMSRGERLRVAREAAGYKSKRAAAIALDVPVSTYNSHERAGEPGGRDFDPEHTPLYASRFAVSPEWLLTGTGQPPKGGAAPALVAPKPEISAPLPLPDEGNERMPILGTANGGADGALVFDGEIIEWARRPDYLLAVKGAYAVYVQGESMVPVFRPGIRLDVHPNLPAARGDAVVVQLYPEEEHGLIEGYIKEYVTRTPTMLVVKQYNPEKEIEYPRDRVKSVHVVVGTKLR